jgi:RNA polymerase sigma factor (sigma-70 family)
VIVKAHVVRLAAGGAKVAALHLRYIERDGVEKDGSPGALYGPDGPVPADVFREPRLDEKHQFRLVVSPEEIDASEAARYPIDGDERSMKEMAEPRDRAQSRSRRIACAVVSQAETPVGLAAADEFAASPEELVANAQMRDVLRKTMARLPDRERKVVEGYYAGRKLKELGTMVGVSESWASRVLARALIAIRRDWPSMKPQQ